MCLCVVCMHLNIVTVNLIFFFVVAVVVVSFGVLTFFRLTCVVTLNVVNITSVPFCSGYFKISQAPTYETLFSSCCSPRMNKNEIERGKKLARNKK